MVTTVVRDKYVQSETITERAEEAGELMTRMEENDEILSQSLTVIWQQWKQVGLFFFPHASGGNEWHPQPPSLSLSFILLSSSPLTVSPTPFATFL